MEVCAFALYGSQAASTRYRLEQYIPGLKSEGIDLCINPLLGDRYINETFAGKKYRLSALCCDYFHRFAALMAQKRFHAAIIQGELLPFVPGIIESNLMRIPYIYDFDDAFFLKYRRNKLRHLSFLLKGKFQPVISRASAILAGNRHLATYANRFNPATTLLPTVVDLNRYAPLRSKRDAVFTVGWIGSPSTSVYLSALAPPWLNWVERGRFAS